MYSLKNKKLEKLEKVTFSELGMTESDIEEILRMNSDMVCDDEESLLIVGQQVKNELKGRSDLTAIDNNGNLVLIELKRDKKDIEMRRESFEFQAIRYAASYATIKSVEEIVKIVYMHYIDKYKSEFCLGELTTYEQGLRKIKDFLRANQALERFNEKQRIILAASDFDSQTLSAVAWLNANHVDISCYKLEPYRIGDEIVIQSVKILPVDQYDDYYVNLLQRSDDGVDRQSSGVARRSYPKIDQMLEWGVVKAGDVIQALDRDDEAILMDNGRVNVNGQEMSLQVWLRGVYGWSSVATYGFSVHKETGKTLSLIRDEYMEAQQKEEAE
jgi:hypothetical protein